MSFFGWLQGEGVDSYLHPRNRKFALQVLTFLTESCFHYQPLLSSEREQTVANLRYRNIFQ